MPVLNFGALKEAVLPDWTKPENASVFDPAYRAPVRTLIKWLGLDDPQQAMALGMPLETGAMSGGAVEAIAKRFPRFAEALKLNYTTPGQAPFYSRLEEAVGGLPRQVPGPKLLGVVQKGQASAEELAARGVPEFAAQYGTKPIPKEAIAEHLKANPVQLQVKTLGGKEPPPLSDPRLGNFPTPTKFSQWQLPGGTNYRETLIQLPAQQAPELKVYAERAKQIEPELKSLYAQLDREPSGGSDQTWSAINALQEEYHGLMKRMSSEPVGMFKSSHFDEPNILVHTRSNERDLPGLGKGTFLEEVQSDWHQKGKAEGYSLPPNVTAPMDSEYRALIHKNAAAREAGQIPLKADIERAKQLEDALIRSDKSKIPDAPFKETWPDLALKHHLVEAAQNPETQWLGFTSGETQAARYDLSKQIHSLEYNATSNVLSAYDPRSTRVIDEVVKPDKLADFVGKEAAQKLLDSAPHTTARGSVIHRLEGQDLKVGGEGMKYLYDTLLPKRLEKIVKPFGGTVERMPIQAGTKFKDAWVPGHPEIGEHVPVEAPAWILRLTPDLKKRILTEGLPLMTGVAGVGLASETQKGQQ